MDLKKTIEILVSHNRWRRGDDLVKMTDQKELGEALANAINELKKVEKRVAEKSR